MARPQDLIELETKLGFLERTVEQLNEVVIQQASSLERLEDRVTMLEGRLAGQGDPGQAPGDPEERPPHY